MSTLYLSDLDGTLLRSDQHTSAFTNETINRLVARGLCFSYATARSYQTASRATRGLTAQFPLIVYNGAFIVDNRTQELLLKNTFAPEAAQLIWQDFMDSDLQPIVYSLIDGRERFMYRPDLLGQDAMDFVASRHGDPRDTPVDSNAALLQGETFYFTCIGNEARLQPLWEKHRNFFQCVWHRDIYSGARWLEIMPQSASKAQAARQLATHLGCERIVAFGDAVNDIPLFEAANECYAVANAAEALKQQATTVIGSNDEDAVAHWLLMHAK